MRDGWLADWHTVTRLGQAELALPAALLAIAVLFCNLQTRRLALRWWAGLVLACLITLATKLAFIGWGIGWAEADFTGASGHTMLAAATYPVLFVAFAAGQSPRASFSLQATGWGLALVVAVSRLMVGAHTPSEVVAGFVLGGAASAIALAKADWLPLSVHPVALIALLVWFSTGAVDMPPSQTHSRITQLALAMSGNKAPFERKEILLPRLVINPL